MFSQTSIDLKRFVKGGDAAFPQNAFDAVEQLGAYCRLPGLSRPAVELIWIYMLWTQRRQSRRDLARLDARMLRDIGVAPKDAQRESRKWFWRP